MFQGEALPSKANGIDRHTLLQWDARHTWAHCAHRHGGGMCVPVVLFYTNISSGSGTPWRTCGMCVPVGLSVSNIRTCCGPGPAIASLAHLIGCCSMRLVVGGLEGGVGKWMKIFVGVRLHKLMMEGRSL